MFFKKRGPEVRKCPRGHILDPDWDQCPYCAAQQSDEFLDESRATHRPPPASGPGAPLPPLPPPSPPAPVSARPPAPPGAPPPRPPTPPYQQPPPALDPDLTQVSRPGSLPPPTPGPLPPPPADGSGPPPLVEFSDAQGRPAAAQPSAPSRPAPPPMSPPLPPPLPPALAPAAAAAPRPFGGSLDDQTRILHAPAASGGLTIAWLVAASGAMRGQDFRIQPGGARIGRLPTCGVCLPQGQEFGVSKEHAEVRIGGGVCVLVDLESANGTFVNGERVNERVLQDGDRVRLGLLEFVFKSMVL